MQVSVRDRLEKVKAGESTEDWHVASWCFATARKNSTSYTDLHVKCVTHPVVELMSG